MFPPKGELRRFVSHPAVLIVSRLANLVGIPLSVYLYFAAKQHPQLTYYVHPVKAALVRRGDASRLGATFDNRRIETDIMAAQVAIWNEGGLPRKEIGVVSKHSTFALRKANS
jgi:hypothetical protein